MTGALRLSVVIATRHRPQLLARCLDAMSGLDPRETEILVVDNSDGDAEAQAVATAAGATCITEPRTGLSIARNSGARTARGAIVAFVDDDAIPQPGWSAALTSPFADPAVMAVTGRVLPIETASPHAPHRDQTGVSIFTREVGLRIDHSVQDALVVAAFGGAGIGTNMAFRRACFDDWLAFREDLGRGALIDGYEEHFAFASVIERGHRLVYTPQAVVLHPVPEREYAIAGRRLRDRATFAAYCTLLLFAKRRHRRTIARYLLEGLQGTARPWRSPAPGSRRRSLLTRPLDAIALLGGPILYAASRLRTRDAGRAGRTRGHARPRSSP